ncbi:PadR family transcriptional regulator [Oceanotoga sp. DSM 15011]|jgi:DNA-binding PadR family transcriptional regulator|uniref:PadR family transcriptional regulator n=1 Tax=Oceanotoga teriensis TaxID=515440 RepID=A0AA45C4W6_9BACT|nr:MULTISPECIES: PadR family transcriptional regulator [Oceanotoga]MDN5341341.1 hypothetical protein [Oceanotoga sp.]MDO7976933.1 PadR family transcriptional regulator [Oceanotoga teriensis]PWJ87402.1 PadR family transcriptional regulator [Oceanotoga teriensis]UYO99596.1 PadR family transcriptional regulator [Oceanotoga sp. DSM 15011]
MAKLPFLKFLMIQYLIENGEITGYSFIKFCKRKDIPVSSGTVYPHLKTLSDNGIIDFKIYKNKKIYSFTDYGKEYSKEMYKKYVNLKKEVKKIDMFFTNIPSNYPENIKTEFNILYSLYNCTDYYDIKDLKKIKEKLLNILDIIDAEIEKDK